MWDEVFHFDGVGGAPTLTTEENKTDKLVFAYEGKQIQVPGLGQGALIVSLPISSVAPFIGQGTGNPNRIPSGRHLFVVSSFVGRNSLWIINPVTPAAIAAPYGNKDALPAGIGRAYAVVSWYSNLLVFDRGNTEALWLVNPHEPGSVTPPYGKVGNLPSAVSGSVGGAAVIGDEILIAYFGSGDYSLWRVNFDDPDSTSGVYGKVGRLGAGAFIGLMV